MLCGLFIVDYDYGVSVNIGDYIQSIAAMQYCKGFKVSYIERDSLSKYRGEKVKIIMNAWWRINKNNMIPSKDIFPLYISYHLDNPSMINSEYINYLKKYQPIGCRDTYTTKIIHNAGIESYFSGCLTLTLGKTYKNKHNYNFRIIYITDCKLCEKHIQLIMNYIKNITSYTNYKIIYISHIYGKSINHKERYEIADKILRKYQSAYLVLTSRLHACLPCIAMNTSVILIKEKLDTRFSGLIDFTNYIIINKTNTYINVLHKSETIYNPNTYKNYTRNLDKRVKSFF